MTPAEQKAELVALCVVAFGKNWKSPLAKVMPLHVRNVRRMFSSARPIPQLKASRIRYVCAAIAKGNWFEVLADSTVVEHAGTAELKERRRALKKQIRNQHERY